MSFILTFIEGFLSFISPCVLPMLPVYVIYFAGGEENNKIKTLKNSCGFVLGFTIVFVILGVFAGALGSLLNKYHSVINIIYGIIMMFFGLCYAGVFKFNFGGVNYKGKNSGFFSAVIFGILFSVSMTPCAGPLLGSALTLAASNSTALKGALLLFVYSLGLGIPFILSALLIDKLKSTFNFIKRHTLTISRVCGIFLCILGVLYISGLYGKLI